MSDIEVIKEKIIKPFYEFPNPISIELKDTDVKLIENLINRVKELEEIEKEHQKINGELQEKNKKYKEVISNLNNNWISKEKIKAKIEELLNSYMKVVKIEDTIMSIIHNEKIDNQIKILQELLEDKNE